MNQQPPSRALISQAELKIGLEASHWPLKVSGLAMTCVTSAHYSLTTTSFMVPLNL